MEIPDIYWIPAGNYMMPPGWCVSKSTRIQRHPPFLSVWDGADSSAGIDYGRSRLEQQLVERSLPEELLQLLVTHFLQSLHAAVEQRIGASGKTQNTIWFFIKV